MSNTQKSMALSLADKYEIEGLHARIAELEAQLSAIAHIADGVPAQTETLLAELAKETEAADNWRRLALQFDHHRMQALGHLKAILHPDSSVDEYKAAELFLKAPPLDGEEVLAQRIATLAATQPAAQGMEKDAARLLYATKDYDGFVHVKRDKYDFALECMEEAGRSEPTIEDELNGVRRLIDTAIAAQAKQGGSQQ